jgi:uncharacterized delta-60 repeat protein
MEQNLVKTRIMPAEKAARLRATMERYFPEAEVRGYAAQIAVMQNHVKDRHVAAAAVKAGAQVIATANLKHFAHLPGGILAQGPDEFLCNLFDLVQSDGMPCTCASRVRNRPTRRQADLGRMTSRDHPLGRECPMNRRAATRPARYGTLAGMHVQRFLTASLLLLWAGGCSSSNEDFTPAATDGGGVSAEAGEADGALPDGSAQDAAGDGGTCDGCETRPFCPTTEACAAGYAEVHWVGNQGAVESHVQNLIEDMFVYSDGVVFTKSFYDEGLTPDGVYSLGMRVAVDSTSKLHPWMPSASQPTPPHAPMPTGPIAKSLTASGKVGGLYVTCEIQNFYGRFFSVNGRMTADPVPTGALAPKIACSNGATISTDLVPDPSAVAFGNDGTLLVADNGVDQNIKTFDLASGSARQTGTFGEKGGVYAGPVPGRAGDLRFYGIRGLGVDERGNIYVGMTGFPGQTGGTDIRVFAADGKTLLWKAQGFSFVDAGDADPTSDGKSIYFTSERFDMDYAKQPGRSWSLGAITLDPFRYPDDPRLRTASATAWVRVIEGKKFVFATDMYQAYVSVFRIEDNSEIARPVAVIATRDSAMGSTGAEGWAVGVRPAWVDTTGYCPRPAPLTTLDQKVCANPVDAPPRWMWVDKNGDAVPTADEFETFNLSGPAWARSLDVDDAGNVLTGGQDITYIPHGGLDANGVPKYSPSLVEAWGLVDWNALTGVAPKLTRKYPDGFQAIESGGDPTKTYATRLKHLAAEDTLFVASGAGGDGVFLNRVYRIDHWSDAATRAVTMSFDAEYSSTTGDLLKDIQQNLPHGIYPTTFTSDGDYVYVGFTDQGPTAHSNGEVSVWDARKGVKVTTLAPDANTMFGCGWIDLPNGINAVKRSNAERVVMLEDDYGGKVLAYRFCPPGAACMADAVTSAPADGPADPTLSAKGALASGFGASGKVLESAPAGASNAVSSEALLRLSDGRILVAQTAEIMANNMVTGALRVRRYGADGALDATFGASGAADVMVAGKHFYARGLALEPGTGRIVAVGTNAPGATPRFALVCRMSAAGVIDTTFGDAGGVPGCATFVNTDSPRQVASYADGTKEQNYGVFNAAAVLPSGKILLAELDQQIFYDSGYATLVRLKSDGTLDDDSATGFGPGHAGFARIPYAQGWALALADPTSEVSDVYMAGSMGGSLAFWRFAADGQLLQTVVDANVQGRAQAIALDPTKRVLVAGVQFAPQLVGDPQTASQHSSGLSSFAVLRYRPDGQYDMGWGRDGNWPGHVLLRGANATNDYYDDAKSDLAMGLALDGNGRVVAVGKRSTATAGVSHAVVYRLTPTGHLDTTFAEAGVLELSSDNGWSSGVVVDSATGQLFVVGAEHPAAGGTQATLHKIQ